jgi:GAF domain-containing protein
VRLAAADRSGDIALLAEMSREIASTLDLDRVLRVAINLAARAITFDRGALALHEHGVCDVRAVAGTAAADPKDPSLQDLAARAEWAAGTGEGLLPLRRGGPGERRRAHLPPGVRPRPARRRRGKRALPARSATRRGWSA